MTWTALNLTDKERRVDLLSPQLKGESVAELVVLPARSLHVRGALGWVSGEGMQLGPVKARASRRTLRLPNGVHAVLVSRAERLGVDIENPPELPVFASPLRPQVWRDGRNFARSVSTLYAAHGIDWARTHSARKYVTTKLHRGGWSDDRIVAWMGWDDRATLARYLDKRQDVPDAYARLDLATPAPR